MGQRVELHISDRGATRDIDSAIFRKGSLDAIIAELAAEHGLPAEWLNDKASLFLPDYEDPLNWPLARQLGAVTVRVAPLETLCAMKLRAARGRRDFDDLELIIEALGWDRSRVEQEHDARYPNDPLSSRARAYLDRRWSASQLDKDR